MRHEGGRGTHLNDLLLDRVARNEFIRVAFLRLSNTTHTSNCLLFDKGIPPGIKENHIVARDDVEP